MFERSGRLYLYGQPGGWIATVTPQGIYRPSETPQGRFAFPAALDYAAGLTGISIIGPRLIADTSGIYQLDFDGWEIRQLSTSQASFVAMACPTAQDPRATLWTRHEDTIRRFDVRAVNADQSLPSIDSELIAATRMYPLGNVNLKPTGRWSLDWVDRAESTDLSVASISNDRVLIATAGRATHSTEAGVLSQPRSAVIGEPGGTLNQSVSLPNGEMFVVQARSDRSVPWALTLPPGLLAGSVALVSLTAPRTRPNTE